MSTVKVQISMTCRAQFGAIVEMTREQFDKFNSRLDEETRGFAAERLAEEIMDAAGLDLRHADFDNYEVEDFMEVAK